MHPSRLVQVIQIIHRRRARRAAQRCAASQRALQFGSLLLGVAGLSAALLALATFVLYRYVSTDLPPVEQLALLLDPQRGLLLQPSRLYDSTGQHLLASLEQPGAERRFVKLPQSSWLAQAFVAASEPDFWNQNNFHWPELKLGPRGLAEKLTAKMLLATEPDGRRKTLRAWMLGAAATRHYGHAQVLTWALNSATFGQWTFGAESAAHFYFGKSAKDLTLGEAATLAAVEQAPELNPLDSPELAKKFRDLVLIAMRDKEQISQEQLNAALAKPLGVVPAVAPTSETPDFTDLALKQVTDELGIDLLERGGLKVITTLDFDTQEAAASLAAGSAKPIEVAVFDPLNGRVIAMLGPAVASTHSPGEIFSPFIYLSAYARGYSPASLTWDYGPATSAALFHGPVSLRQALANNYVVPTESLVSEIGASDLAATLRAVGFAAFRSQLSEAESLRQIEGATQISSLETAVALGILSNQGIRAGKLSGEELIPATILFVSNEQGRILLDWSRPDVESISTPELAYLVTDVLSDARLREKLAISLDRPVALLPIGPTGSDGAWAVGYSPQRVVVLWANNQDEIKASNLWAALFEAAHQGLPIRHWEIPAGLNSVTVCVPSGQLPDEDCPETRRELFLSGNEPRHLDSLFLRTAINSLNGKLATVFTPQEFVEEKLFINVPPFAKAWAQAAGLPVVPDEYDPLPALSTTGLISFTQPLPFSQAKGVVQIMGSLGTDAVAYDVQVGEGLRPTQWMQIVQSNEPATSQLLASWDTTGLKGLWAIQLQTWDSNGKLYRAYTVVTLGN